jgi:hypothetical protein
MGAFPITAWQMRSLTATREMFDLLDWQRKEHQGVDFSSLGGRRSRGRFPKKISHILIFENEAQIRISGKTSWAELMKKNNISKSRRFHGTKA